MSENEKLIVEQVRLKDTGFVVKETFYNDEGKIERGNLPALVWYDDKTGQPNVMMYYKNGVQHREEGPASLEINLDTGVIVSEEWIENGKRHRVGGPAYIVRDGLTGEVELSKFYLHGKWVGNDVEPDEDEFEDFAP